MIPASTNVRKPRESSKGKVEGRTQEIQRLIGRSLRSIIDLIELERELYGLIAMLFRLMVEQGQLPLQGFIALVHCINWMIKHGMIEKVLCIVIWQQ